MFTTFDYIDTFATIVFHLGCEEYHILVIFITGQYQQHGKGDLEKLRATIILFFRSIHAPPGESVDVEGGVVAGGAVGGVGGHQEEKGLNLNSIVERAEVLLQFCTVASKMTSAHFWCFLGYILNFDFTRWGTVTGRRVCKPSSPKKPLWSRRPMVMIEQLFF